MDWLGGLIVVSCNMSSSHYCISMKKLKNSTDDGVPAQSGLSQEGNLAINVKTVRTRGSMDRIFILVLNITTDFVE